MVGIWTLGKHFCACFHVRINVNNYHEIVKSNYNSPKHIIFRFRHQSRMKTENLEMEITKFTYPTLQMLV